MDLNFFKRDYNFFKVFSIFSIFIIIFLKKFNYIEIEAIDFDILMRIIDPNIAKGSIIYDPIHNFNYLVFYLYKILGENLKLSLQVIWFTSELLVLYSFKKIIKKFFSNNFLTFFLVFLLYISFRSGQIDQKSFSYPFIYLSIYYFFSEKFYKGFSLLAIIFYLHIGLGIWTSIPLSLIFFIYNYKSLIKIITRYSFFLILISPIIYFYSLNILFAKTEFDEEIFLFYWKGNLSNSLYTYFFNFKHTFNFFIFNSLLIIFFFKFKTFDLLKKNFSYFLFGIWFMFFLNFIFCDILNISYAIKLQLLRVDYFLYFLAMFISCFFISLEAKKERYIPLVIYLIIVIPNIIHLKYGTIYLREFFSSIILICLILRNNDFYLILNSYLNRIFSKLIKIDYKKIYIYIFLVFFIQKSFSLTPFNENIKQKVNEKKIDLKLLSKSNFFYNESLKFINEDLNNKKDIVFLTPFYEQDTKYLINYKLLFSPAFFTDYNIPKIDIFNKIINEDLNINKKEIFYTDWKKIWDNIGLVEIEKWRINYGLTHLLSENDKIYNYEIVYKNELYTIYDLNK
jgi:hypothetical protein